MKSSIFWDIMPYDPLKANQCFRGTCSLHLLGQRICQERNQHEVGSKQTLKMEVKIDWLLKDYMITSQKIELFITTALRTSNSTQYLTVFCLEKWNRLNLCEHYSISEGILYNTHNIQTCASGCWLSVSQCWINYYDNKTLLIMVKVEEWSNGSWKRNPEKSGLLLLSSP
jgi:hypothetical protein